MKSRKPEVHTFIANHIEATGAAPMLREIADGIGMSKPGVWKHVQSLLHEGALVRKGVSFDLPGRVDLAGVGTEQLRAELARRGVTLDALETPKLLLNEGRPCAANHCFERVQRGHLMCRAHWFDLPSRMRSTILSAWRARDVQAYSQAVEAARDFLGGYNRVVDRVA